MRIHTGNDTLVKILHLFVKVRIYLLILILRIRTGEKPYICEVCDKAFARRDKLVIHMNKFKHVTPTNIAPLGKRLNNISSDGKYFIFYEIPKVLINIIVFFFQNAETKKKINNENKQNLMHSQLHQDANTANILHDSLHNTQTTNQHQTNNIPSIQNHPTNQPLSWSCELCGRMFATREEWSIHAKSHLEVS